MCFSSCPVFIPLKEAEIQSAIDQLYSEWVYSILLEYACASCLACTMPVRIHINRSMPESVLSSVKGFSANTYVTGSLHCQVSYTLQHSSTCALLLFILQQTVGARLGDWLCSVLDFSTLSVPNPPSHQVLLMSSSRIFWQTMSSPISSLLALYYV